MHERPSGAFRLPEQRVTEAAYEHRAAETDYQPLAPYATPDPLIPPVAAPPVPPSAAEPTAVHDQLRMPVRGAEYPAVRPNGGPLSLADRATEPSYEPAHPEPAERIYRTRRPVSALVVAGVTGVLLVPALVLLFTQTFLRAVTVQGVVPAVLLTLGLTLSGLGLFAVSGEAPATRADWLRPPVVHLPIGLVLLIAAALAV